MIPMGKITKARPTKDNAHYYAAIALTLATLCQLGFDVPVLVSQVLGVDVRAENHHGTPTPAPAISPVPSPTSDAIAPSSELALRFADLGDPCEESWRRWGKRLRGCPEPTAGDRWSADQVLDQVSAQLEEVRRASEDPSGDAILWIDQRGNLVLAAPVERILLPELRRLESSATARCRESWREAPHRTIICLADDRLAPEHWED